MSLLVGILTRSMSAPVFRLASHGSCYLFTVRVVWHLQRVVSTIVSLLDRVSRRSNLAWVELLCDDHLPGGLDW